MGLTPNGEINESIFIHEKVANDAWPNMIDYGMSYFVMAAQL